MAEPQQESSEPTRTARMPRDVPNIDVEKHTRYWLRCFKTYLPSAYTSTDSNRMFLAFMTLASLDVLGVLSSGKIKDGEISDGIAWIRHCEHPDGGFRAFPGTDFGSERRNEDNACWDPANSAGTLFALLSLIMLGDDLRSLDREKCIDWVRKLQAEDGSFAELLGPDGRPGGRRDIRHTFFAVAVLYILGIRNISTESHGINREKLLDSIYVSQAFDGGTGDAAGGESHGGYAYCSIATLCLLSEMGRHPEAKESERTAKFKDNIIKWLMERQVYHSRAEDSDEEDGVAESTHDAHHTISGSLDSQGEEYWIAFNGRCNKPADTCYSFWVGGPLAILGMLDHVDTGEHRRFLLERTEHAIGGFGKFPGDLPDMMHSYTGLLALAYFGDQNLKTVDPTFGVTSSTMKNLDKISYDLYLKHEK